jgi:hypothetical protein
MYSYVVDNTLYIVQNSPSIPHQISDRSGGFAYALPVSAANDCTM